MAVGVRIAHASALSFVVSFVSVWTEVPSGLLTFFTYILKGKIIRTYLRLSQVTCECFIKEMPEVTYLKCNLLSQIERDREKQIHPHTWVSFTIEKSLLAA